MKKIIEKINQLFNDVRLRKFFLKIRLPAGIIFLVWLLLNLDPAWFWIGLAVSVPGELLQVWCLSTIKTAKRLTTEGPYMFVRNPMYIGRFFMLLGILLMTGNFILVGIYVVIYYFYMTNRVKREEELLAKLFGRDYEEYKALVPAYIPTFAQFDTSRLWHANKESLAQNHALQNLALTFAVYVICWFFAFHPLM